MGRVPKKKGGGEENEEKRGMKGAERSAYFARREAAKVLRVVLEGDAKRRALASIKSLIYKPSVRNKKATFALICQTLKRNQPPFNNFHFSNNFSFYNIPSYLLCSQIFQLLRMSWKLLLYSTLSGRYILTSFLSLSFSLFFFY